MVGLFVVAALSAALYVRSQTRQDALRAARQDVNFTASTAAKQLGDFVSLVRATTQQLAANPQITQVLVNPAACSLSFAGLGGPDGSHLDVLRRDGAVACSSRSQSDHAANYRDGDWLQQALTRPILIAPRVDPVTRKHVAIVAAPIPDRKGVVAAFVDLSSTGSQLASLYGGGHAIEVLVTSGDGGRVIARSLHSGRWLGASLAGTAFARSTGAVERNDLDGTARLYGRTAVLGTGWQLYAGEDKAAALSAATRLERRQLAIICVGLLAVLLAAWLAYRNLVVPIRRLRAYPGW